MSERLGYCDTFWGSHGCSLVEGHISEVHECVLVVADENGDVTNEAVCSQMRKLDDTGKGEVRFNYVDGSGWGPWKSWDWFTNHGTVR